MKKTNRYPDGENKKLKESISKKFKLPEANLFCGNGSDEILGIACQLFLKKGDEVIIPKHSFLMFDIYSKINKAIISILDKGYRTKDIHSKTFVGILK